MAPISFALSGFFAIASGTCLLSGSWASCGTCAMVVSCLLSDRSVSLLASRLRRCQAESFLLLGDLFRSHLLRFAALRLGRFGHLAPLALGVAGHVHGLGAGER